ncbi:hypothetical protein [uncultured Dechloromonas sp.]|uniref:hypothetical protein n=1 Tax=uncultured Dechloromonas sp. TaxID=171719 RepID=UPI0025F2C32F|nr:hypothetical protein [uncultured Dechloromonas sp.]
MNSQALSSFIWSVADLLHGNFKQSEYGKVILKAKVIGDISPDLGDACTKKWEDEEEPRRR